MTNSPAPVRRSTAPAWAIYVLQMLGSGVLGLGAITSVFMTDSCGSVVDEPAVCNSGYFGSVLFGFWGALLILAILVPVAIVQAGRRGKSSWPFPLGAILLIGALTVLFVALMVR